MEQLWAACEQNGGSKRGCVWRRQIDDALSWIKDFLDNQHGPLRREWKLQALLAEATKVMLVFDACPWGLGAVLYINGEPIQYFTSALSAIDEVWFQYRIGDSDGQQAWEALAVLVALRLWCFLGFHEDHARVTGR